MAIDFKELNELLDIRQDTLDELKGLVLKLDDNSKIEEFDSIYNLLKKVAVQDKALPYINHVLLLSLDEERMVMQ